MVKHETKRAEELLGPAASPESNGSADIDESLKNELEQVGAEFGKRVSD